MYRLRQTLFACVCLCVLLTAFGFPDVALGSAPAAGTMTRPSIFSETSVRPAPSLPRPAVTLADIRARLPGDVAAGSPGADAICFVSYYDLLPPGQDGCFHPEDLADRAAVASALFALSKQSAPDYDGRFPDVETDDPRAAALLWCVEQELLSQDEDGAIQPDRPVTRGELAAMLRRFAALQGWDTDPSGDLSQYWDAPEFPPELPDGITWSVETGSEVPAELRDDLSWAVGSGVFQGLAGNYLLPDTPLTRAQLAQTLVCLTALSPTERVPAIQIARNCQAHAAKGVSFEQRDIIQATVNEIAQKYHAVGIQVAVIENGVPSASFAGGWATRPGKASYASAADSLVYVVDENTEKILVSHKGDGDPMTPDHKERIASISKVAVGIAAMSLAEDGIVDLDKSIGTYWNSTVRNTRYPNDPISVDNLLSHTSSITLAESGAYSYNAVRQDLTSRLSSARKPGSINSWSYSNYGFGILGMTLELAADQMMDDILDERFFDLLNIDAAFRPDRVEAQDKLVAIYDANGSLSRSIQAQRNVGKRSTEPGSYGGVFSGGLTISARDMSKLVAVLANDGTYEGLRLLSADSVAHMEEQLGTTSEGFQQCYPLRHRNEMYGRDELYYHTGSAWGVYNCMSYDPATGDGVVVLTSGASSARDKYGVYAVCGEINQTIYDLLK